jgi:hypothetical protein
MEVDMPKERHRIKTECPECGCGLICNMTPDAFREKYGDIEDKANIDWSEFCKTHEGFEVEKDPATPKGEES